MNQLKLTKSEVEKSGNELIITQKLTRSEL